MKVGTYISPDAKTLLEDLGTLFGGLAVELPAIRRRFTSCCGIFEDPPCGA